MNTPPAPASPSASVVVVRDGAGGLEVLLVRRNEKIVFHGGSWVFPGGRVDPADLADDASNELQAARQAAVREAMEETGLTLSADALLPFAHWTTPVGLPKRFATWFFCAVADAAANVRIDGDEIVDYRWLTPAAALASREAGKIELPAPAFVTLLDFCARTDCAALTAHLRATDIRRFVPRLVDSAAGRCTLYAEDAGYEHGDFDAPGARHRLIMKPGAWEYLREF